VAVIAGGLITQLVSAFKARADSARDDRRQKVDEDSSTVIAADDVVQLLTLLASLVGVAIFIAWSRWSRRSGYAVAPLSYFVHRVIFYLVLIVDPSMDNRQVVMWSSALSLHSVLMLLLGGIAMYQIARFNLKRA